MYTKKCANPDCTVVFSSPYPQKKFCDKCGFSCYRANSHPKRLPRKEIKTCPICHKKFLALSGYSKWGTPFQKYCSPECAVRGRQQRKIENNNTWSDGSPV